MSFIRKYYQIVLTALFFLFVFTITSHQITDPDSYMHLAAGKVIAHQGIIHYEVLSQAGSSRRWLNAEWLFEIAFYWFTLVFGYASLNVFVGLLSVIQVAALYVLLRRILRLNVPLSLVLSMFYVLSAYPYLLARPQIVSMTLFIVEIYVLLLYILKDKNVLFILFPLTYLWANLHSSVIFSPILCLAYAGVCVIYASLNVKEIDVWLKKSKILGLYTIGMVLVSVLPPQGFVHYENVLDVGFKYEDIITHVVSEWLPLDASIFQFALYSCIVGLMVGCHTESC